MSVAKQAARGVAWYMALGVTTRLLQLAGTLIVTRFVTTDEYGAVTAASIVVMTASAVTSFSFGQYLIAKKSPAEIAAQAAAVHVALGLLAVPVVLALRGWLGEVWDAPDLGRYVPGFALSMLVIDRARYIPERLLIRGLRFRAIATINGLGEIAFTLAALATAWRWGGYAIVVASLVRSVLTATLFLAVAPRAEWFVRLRVRLDDVRALLTYGLPIMVAVITDTATKRWDNAVVSKLFHTSVMARYQLSYSLAEMPISHVAEHIGEVLMPAFSRMEEGQRERAAIRAAALMGVVVSPLGVGLGAIAPTVVALFFNKDWAEMMDRMLMILSVMTVFRPMPWSAIAFAQAVQRTGIVMWSSFLRAIVVLSLVALCGTLGGPYWACVGAGAGYAVHSVFTIVGACRATGLPATAYLVGAARPLVACAPMFLAVVATGRALTRAGVPLWLSLAAQLACGAVVYIGAAFVVCRTESFDLIRIGKEAIGRRRPTQARPGVR
jgi:lipopolysaccharide exporter